MRNATNQPRRMTIKRRRRSRDEECDQLAQSLDPQSLDPHG